MSGVTQERSLHLLRAPIWTVIIGMNIGFLVGVAYDKEWSWMAIGGGFGLAIGVVIMLFNRSIRNS